MIIILTIIQMLPLINFIIGKSSKSFFGFPTYKIISINIFNKKFFYNNLLNKAKLFLIKLWLVCFHILVFKAFGKKILC